MVKFKFSQQQITKGKGNTARATFVEANFLCRRWTLIKIKSPLEQSVPKFYPPRKLVYVISTTILNFIIVILSLYVLFIYRAIYSERSVMKIATTTRTTLDQIDRSIVQKISSLPFRLYYIPIT